MPFPIDPSVFAGLSKLGLQQPGATPALNKSDADTAALAWRKQRQDAMDAAIAEAPPKESIGRALLGSVVAGVLAGAAGTGGEGGIAAMGHARDVGSALIQEQNDAAMKEHADRIANATKVVESYDDLTKGMRMILQAQPGLIPGDMMPLAAEIAFPGTGLRLQSKTAGIPESSQKMIDAIDFIIKSNDVRDPTELSRLHNLRATLAGLPKDALTTPISFLDNGKLSEQWLLEHAINGRFLAEKQNRGQRIDINDVDLKPTDKVSYDEFAISALQRWSKIIVEQQLPREEAFKQLDPADQEILNNKFGGDRTGELDMSTAISIALRTLLKGGETQQILAGGLKDENYWNNLLGEYLQKAREDSQSNLQSQVERQIEDEQSRIMKETGADEADAEEQAVEIVRKKLRRGGYWSRLDPDFRDKYGE